MRKLFLLLVVLLLHDQVHGQEVAPEGEWDFEVRAGINVNLCYALRGKQSFPGIKVYASYMTGKTLGSQYPAALGGTLSMYMKSLGNDLNQLVDDVQFDLAANFGIGVAGTTKVDYPKYARTFHNSPAYNVKHNHENAVFTSMTVIFNNHGRHQIINSFMATIGNLTLNYFNDGGPLVQLLPLSDKFDRYWTGGAEIITHSRKGYNSMELGYDQFTGYSPLVYEFSSLLGLNVPEYKSGYGKKGISTSVNSSSYHLRLGIDEFTSVDVGIIGSMQHKCGDGRFRYFSAQDLIHIANGVALHPNYDTDKVYVGYTHNRSFYTTSFR
jgi:hypothetical protein